jgi:hypothetical protein
MRHRASLVTLTLAAGLVLAAAGTALTQQPPATPPPATQPPPGQPPPMRQPRQARGPHPHIQTARRALVVADRQLSEAAHDYGGHRAKALELVKQAQAEVQEALAYAQAHPDEFKDEKK